MEYGAPLENTMTPTDLQTLLNAAGARPPLDVDGDAGPLTLTQLGNLALSGDVMLTVAPAPAAPTTALTATPVAARHVAIQAAVAPPNHGSPPDAFLDALVVWFRDAPDEIFAPNIVYDIYSSVVSALGPYQSPLHRRAVMAEVLRVLAALESDWTWTDGRDPGNRNPDPASWEAGAWQVSADSMPFGAELRDLVQAAAGSTTPDNFQHAMKSNHPLAIEYIARLLRRTTHHNGPVLRHEIDPHLSRAAVAEWMTLLADTAPPAPPASPSSALTPVYPIDAASLGRIATLLPAAQAKAREWYQACRAAGLQVQITSGTRTYAQQDALYAQGRTAPGPEVTKARGGQSNHNFGIAWDFAVYVGGTLIYDGAVIDQAGKIAESLGLEWGGDWTSFYDNDHIQMKTGLTLAQMRSKHDAGVPIT